MAMFAGVVVVGDGDDVGVALVLGPADVDALDVGPGVVDVMGADEDDEEQPPRARAVTSDTARTRAVGTACWWCMSEGPLAISQGAYRSDQATVTASDGSRPTRSTPPPNGRGSSPR
jgi:hypothetical protein